MATDWVIDRCDYLQYLGFEIQRRDDGYVELFLPFDEELTTPGVGALHGGVVATLIDNAGGIALRSTLESPTETPHATTDLNVSYLRPPTDDLLAKATVVRAGSSMAVVRVEVELAGSDDSGKRVAVGRVSLHLDRSKEK